MKLFGNRFSFATPLRHSEDQHLEPCDTSAGLIISCREQAQRAQEYHVEKLQKREREEQEKIERRANREKKRDQKAQDVKEKEFQRRIKRAKVREEAKTFWKELVEKYGGDLNKFRKDQGINQLHRYMFNKLPPGNKTRAIFDMTTHPAWPTILNADILPNVTFPDDGPDPTHSSAASEPATQAENPLPLHANNPLTLDGTLSSVISGDMKHPVPVVLQSFEVRSERMKDPDTSLAVASTWVHSIFCMAHYITHKIRAMVYGGFTRDGMVRGDFHTDMDLDVRVPPNLKKNIILNSLIYWARNHGVHYVGVGGPKGQQVEEHIFKCLEDDGEFTVQLIDWWAFRDQNGNALLDFNASALCLDEGIISVIPWVIPYLDINHIFIDIRNHIMRSYKSIHEDSTMEGRVRRFTNRGWTIVQA